MFMFPSSSVGVKDQPRPLSRLEDQPPSGRGSALPPLRRWIKEEQAPSWRAPSVQPRAGLIGPPDEEVPGALQNVSFHRWSLHHGPFDLFCFLTLLLSSHRYDDTGVLSLTPLKHLAQSARVMPSEPRPNLRAPSRCRRRLRRGWHGRRGGGVGRTAPASDLRCHRGSTDDREDNRPKQNWSHRPGLARAARTW
jgi:hypothetical protein